MKRHAAALLLALATATPAGADLVLMDNGDRYTGSVLSLGDGVLRLKTEFGELKLPWGRITELRTDSPLELSLSDGRALSGPVTLTDGRLMVAPEVDVPAETVVSMGTPPAPPATQVTGRVSAGASILRGNTEAQTYHLDGELVVRAARDRYTLGGKGNYGTDDDEQILGDASAYARYDHFFGPRWYFNSNLSLAHDEFRDLALRTTIGLGVGYQFQETSRTKLSAELGGSYVHTNFIDAENEATPAARWALDFQHRFGDGGLQFVHRHELFVGLEDTSDALLRSQTGLRMPLFGSISGGIDVNFDYDWSPPEGAGSADTIYQLKLIYDYGR